MSPALHIAFPRGTAWIAFAVGLVEGALWASVYLSVYIDPVASVARSPSFIGQVVWEAFGVSILLGALACVAVVQFLAALRGPARRAPLRVVGATLLVGAGFLTVASVASLATDPSEFSFRVVGLLLTAFCGLGLAALVAGAVWRGVMECGADSDAGSVDERAPSRENVVRDGVRPPARSALVVSVVLASAAGGWFLGVVADAGAGSDVAGILGVLLAVAVAVLVLCGLATMLQRWTGRLAAWGIVLLTSVAVATAATAWLLRARPASWNLVGLDPSGQALLIRVRAEDPCRSGTPSASVVRRTRTSIELKAAQTVGRSANACSGCSVPAASEAVVRVPLDRAVDGERITGRLARQTPTNAQVRGELGRSSLVMPNVVGLEPRQALRVLGGAPPQFKGERLTYARIDARRRYANRIGDVRFIPTDRRRKVTAQSPPAGTRLTGWTLGPAEGPTLVRHYPRIELTTGS